MKHVAHPAKKQLPHLVLTLSLRAKRDWLPDLTVRHQHTATWDRNLLELALYGPHGAVHETVRVLREHHPPPMCTQCSPFHTSLPVFDAVRTSEVDTAWLSALMLSLPPLKVTAALPRIA